MGLWNDSDSPFASAFQEAEVVSCPRCGSDTYSDDILGKLVCRHCGGAFDKDTHALSYSFDIRDAEEAGLPEKKLREYMCKTCGTAMVSRKGTDPSFCPFCGGKEMHERELTRQFRPDQYIPFKITRDDAILRLKEFASGMKAVPKSFMTEATLSKVMGIYVPFWLIDTDNHLKIRAGATRINGENARKRFDIDVEHDYKLTGIPFDGGKGINDTLMEALEPYDYSDLKPYDDLCLKGYIAERFDEKPLDMTGRIIKRLYMYSNQAPSYLCKDYKDIDIKMNDSAVNNMRQRYVLLPMYYLCYEYEGVRYSFAVNGQTGEAEGDMPVSTESLKRKQLPVKVMLVLPAVLLVAWLVYILFFHTAAVTGVMDAIADYGFFIILFIAAIILGVGNRHYVGDAEYNAMVRENRKAIAGGILDTLESIPDAADKLLADAAVAQERIMDQVPDVGTYISSEDGIEPHIDEKPLTANRISDSKRDAR